MTDLFSGGSQAGLPARLGMVMSGSLTEGLEVRLDGGISVEDMKVGRYVTILGQKTRFFGMITDVRLGAIDPKLAVTPPDVDNPFIAEVVSGTSTFGSLHVLPMLTLADQEGKTLATGPQPVKTVPVHFSSVREATNEDVERVFGREDEQHFSIGTPLDMETKVCLDLKRLTERSSGVFGKSGTGKTFLTRLLLIGIVQASHKPDGAVSLVFDMHNEYGWAGTREGDVSVKALKQLFPSKVAIFSLDPHSSRARGVASDHDVVIAYDHVEPEDLELLREALGMTQAQIESIYRLARRYGDQGWLGAFLATNAEERDELARQEGLNPGTLNVLHRKLETRLARLPFLRPKAPDNSVQRILDYLTKGIHVVLEFGRHKSLDAYMLVANILTRRLHERYVELAEEAMGTGGQQPRPLVIVIEEAHKFLSPEIAPHTIFGTIARELRKYHVTLLVVDQRPSGIDEEVMSQIGTRITCLLDNERDIDAVLTGVSGKKELRAVLAKLDSKQQALIFGHAVPMPVVVKTAEYGSTDSYKKYGFVDPAEKKQRMKDAVKELWG